MSICLQSLYVEVGLLYGYEGQEKEWSKFTVASSMAPWQSHWEEENSEVNHDLGELYKSTVSGSLALTDLAFQFSDT